MSTKREQRTKLTAFAVKDLKQGGVECPRRTLRSPGAERSRLPYAAKPRGRGRAAEEDTQPRPRPKI